MEEKEEQGWVERTDNTHDHRLGDTGHDTADTHEVVAHQPEDISRSVGEASPQAGNLSLVSREETSTYLRTPGMGLSIAEMVNVAGHHKLEPN